MRELDDKIFEAYQKSIQLNEAKGQEAIMGYIEKLDNPDAEIDLNNIARSNKSIKYKDLQNAAKALSKKGKIKFDGFNKINIIKESIDESSISEASVVSYQEVEDRVKKFVDTLFKGTTYKPEKQEYFDGIHGIIVKTIDQMGGPQIRIPKKDLSKIMKNKDVRWVDISAIGM